ncbi:MAG: type 1 glutamine amidotransferase domain-containing protein [Sandaracinus sp.]|nr:type 1 glutamine amidotransferase domain-containing protein [Sandaracinus sp.]|tara:strand:- start:301 stop:1002 length:702 start_codon:yes stop_codon:yes gene_type:complete
MTEQRILCVVTNAGEYQAVGFRTGLWLGELTHFVDVAEEAGFVCDIASPAGGFVPIDPESLMMPKAADAVGFESAVQKRYRDRGFMDRLQDTMPVSEADPARYGAIYLAGGHGTMFDFTSDALAEVVGAFWDAGKIVSAVCHGPAGLLEARDAAGKPIVGGRRVTGFSWREEGLAERQEAVPFNLEERLEEAGADYSKAALPFIEHVVEDERLITGQNPKSATAVAKAVLAHL